MKNLEDLEKIINSELTTKINNSKIKHDQLYINIDEKNLLESSDLKNIAEIPNVIEQEDKLDAKKNEREKLGSVNLRADQETEQYKTTIKKNN